MDLNIVVAILRVLSIFRSGLLPQKLLNVKIRLQSIKLVLIAKQVVIHGHLGALNVGLELLRAMLVYNKNKINFVGGMHLQVFSCH